MNILEGLPETLLLGEVFQWYLNAETALEVACVSMRLQKLVKEYKENEKRRLEEVLDAEGSRRVRHVIRKLKRRELRPGQYLLALERLLAVNSSLPFEWHRKVLKGTRGMTLCLHRDFTVYLSFGTNCNALPESLSRLKTLHSFAASHARIHGSMPISPWPIIATTLKELDLSCNRLSGPLPSAFTQLHHLEYLSLHDNRLSDQLPTDFGALTNLVHCHLWSNKFSGQIPTSIGNLSRLRTLWLHDNMLQGAIPATIGQCHNLEWCSLRDNLLSGAIPQEFGLLSNLKFLYLQRNALQGSIPFSLANCSQLKEIKVQDNPCLNFSHNSLPRNIIKCLNKPSSSSPTFPNTMQSTLFSTAFSQSIPLHSNFSSRQRFTSAHSGQRISYHNTGLQPHISFESVAYRHHDLTTNSMPPPAPTNLRHQNSDSALFSPRRLQRHAGREQRWRGIFSPRRSLDRHTRQSDISTHSHPPAFFPTPTRRQLFYAGLRRRAATFLPTAATTPTQMTIS